ncbi:hypothetical protein EV645_3783 [Kribbella rubisoli]|uniref:Uncharacterized protein n=1 Tax=Kribbella rubisoli TaxID=3075929 RepID=A0A4Q7X059_9ACTN|nr:hypothetical protein EV645_3783 [Kribbella rubisoli]
MSSSESGAVSFGGSDLLPSIEGRLREGALAGAAGEQTGRGLRRLAMTSLDLDDVHRRCLGCQRASCWRELLAVNLGDRNERIRERPCFRGLVGSGLLTGGGCQLSVHRPGTRRAGTRSPASGAGVVANGAYAGGKASPTTADMHSGDTRPEARTNTPTRRTNPNPRRKLHRKTHQDPLDNRHLPQHIDAVDTQHSRLSAPTSTMALVVSRPDQAGAARVAVERSTRRTHGPAAGRGLTEVLDS